MKKISNNLFFIAGIIFIVFTVLAYLANPSLEVLISGGICSLMSILFQSIFNVKWNALARESFLKSYEEINTFGQTLPLKIVGALQLVWIFLLYATLSKPIIVKLFPEFPISVFTIMSNICFSFFIMGIFYQMFQGKLKGVSLSTGLFAIYNIFEVGYNYLFEDKILSTRAMCLFLAFWSIHKIFATTLLTEEPKKPEKKVKEKKNKEKSKKEKKTKEQKAIAGENMVAVQEYLDAQKEQENNNE